MLWIIVLVVSCLGIIICSALMDKEETTRKVERRLAILGILSLIGCVLSVTYLAINYSIG